MKMLKKKTKKNSPVFLPNAFLRAKTSLNFQPKRFQGKNLGIEGELAPWILQTTQSSTSTLQEIPEEKCHSVQVKNERILKVFPGDFLFQEKVLATLVDIIYSCCSPSSLRPLFFQRLFWSYLCWIGTMTTFRSFSLDVVDLSHVFFLVPSTCWSSIYFKVPKERVQERSGWPEPYQGHITIGRFNKRETSSKLQLVSAVLFKIGSILQVFIPIMKSST